jgi:hypothetical protein
MDMAHLTIDVLQRFTSYIEFRLSRLVGDAGRPRLVHQRVVDLEGKAVLGQEHS